MMWQSKRKGFMVPQQIKKVRIARLSIISNTTLMILKLITDFVIGSVSINLGGYSLRSGSSGSYYSLCRR